MKKSFKDQLNPAMQFISTQEETVKTTDAPEGFKVNPLFVETKSRRLQLLLQPSLYDRIKAKATEQGLSVNELAHTILETGTREGG